MIRGAIENVSRNRASGWIWSAEADLRGRQVLAFLDDTCIGAGVVESFRPDLKDAGLGDGVAGYDFEIACPSTADAVRVTVRLEGSDAVLLQRRSRVGGLAAAAAGRPGAARQPLALASLQWMRSRGWLSQADFDFLRFFRRFGVHDRTLVEPRERPEGAAPVLTDPAEVARHLLELHRLEPVEIARTPVPTLRDYRLLAERVEAKAGPGAALALWSPLRGRLSVIEESHRRQDVLLAEEGPPPGIEHEVDADRLLLLDARCALAPGTAFPAGGLEVFHPAL